MSICTKIRQLLGGNTMTETYEGDDEVEPDEQTEQPEPDQPQPEENP